MIWWSAADVALSLFTQPHSFLNSSLHYRLRPFLCFCALIQASHLKAFPLPCLLITPPSPHFPSLTVSAFLFWERRWAGGDIRILAGYVLGNEHTPICLGHGWDGCEKGEWWCRVQLLFWQVVILGGVALIQHPSIREGWCLSVASLLLGEGGGCADTGGL